MSLLGGAQQYNWWYTNQPSPSSTPGTAVTPGANNAEGSPAVIGSAANLTEDVVGLFLVVSGGSTSAAIKQHLLDIGIDPAGGTSYTWVVNDLPVGGSASFSTAAIAFWIPIRIPAGAQVAVRIQGSNATAGTVRVWAIFYGCPKFPELVWAGTYSETLGTITNSGGPVVTPGSSAAEGAWTLLGTTTERLRYWLLGMHVEDATCTAQNIWADLSYDDGSGNKVLIQEHVPFGVSGAEAHAQPYNPPNNFCDVPPGSAIYVRLSTSLATPDTNYRCLAVGIG